MKKYKNKPDNNKFYYHRSGHSKCLEIKHVHTLQNLYFALTGEELTTAT